MMLSMIYLLANELLGYYMAALCYNVWIFLLHDTHYHWAKRSLFSCSRFDSLPFIWFRAFFPVVLGFFTMFRFDEILMIEDV